MEVGVQFQGMEQVVKTLLNLPGSTRRKVIMPALRAGATVVRDQAAANVRTVAVQGYATGKLEREIRFYNYKKLRGAFRVGIQVRRGAVNRKKIVNGQPVRVGLYASVLEYGKKNQPPRSWLRKALREKEQDTVTAVTNYISKNLDQAVKDAQK